MLGRQFPCIERSYTALNVSALCSVEVEKSVEKLLAEIMDFRNFLVDGSFLKDFFIAKRVVELCARILKRQVVGDFADVECIPSIIEFELFHDFTSFRREYTTAEGGRQEGGEALDISAYKYCRACRYCSSHIHKNGSSDLATCEYMAHTGQSRIAACAKLGTSGKVGKGCPCFVPYHPEKDKNANWHKPIALPGSLPRKTQKQDTTAIKRIDHDEALRMHRDGKTDRQIAKHFGVSHSAIWQWRQRQGLPLNLESDEYRARFDRNEALRLYQLGLSDRAIATPLGVTARAIYKWRKRQGMPANHQYRKGGGEEIVGKGGQGGGRDAGGAGRRDG